MFCFLDPELLQLLLLHANKLAAIKFQTVVRCRTTRQQLDYKTPLKRSCRILVSCAHYRHIFPFRDPKNISLDQDCQIQSSCTSAENLKDYMRSAAVES